jgi:hypothetical protein
MERNNSVKILAPLLLVKGKIAFCVSKIEMSPITAKLKCPHGRGKDIRESKAVTEV